MSVDNFVDEFFSEDKVDKNESKKEENFIVGIDLGTTNSCVAIWRDYKVEIIPDELGNKTIPSIVALTDYSCYVGYEAKEQMELNPDNVFYEIKRIIGKKYDEITVQNDLRFFSFKVESDDKGNIQLMTRLKKRSKYTPEEIIAKILIKIKNNVIKYLGVEKVRAVISVPAYFNDAQRQATKDASEIAGIECIRIMSEPIASALAYGIIDKTISEETNKKEDLVVVYDLGGGTLDVSLLRLEDGLFEVLGSAGNTHLGGADFDNRIVGYCLNVFKDENKIDENVLISSLSIQRLKKSCEKAKKRLSENKITNIMVRDFYEDKDLKVVLTVDKFYEICSDLFILCVKPLEDILKSCDITKSDIDYIILVGGMTRVPLIKNNVDNFFEKSSYCSINPDETVAMGTAIQGYILGNKEKPFSNRITLMDNIPLSLGIETSGGIMDILIPRNSVIPVSKKRSYTTDIDDVESIDIKVYEGERLLTKDNILIGKFVLNEITKLPKGIPKIDVKFHIDINGIVSVTAEERRLDGSGNKKSMRITNNKDRLSDEEIRKMIEDARETEEIDRIERRRQKKINIIRGICGNILYSVNDKECLLSDDEKENIKKEIAEIVIPDEDNKIDEMIKIINEKYGVLTLPSMKNTNELQPEEKDKEKNFTSVYDDEDEYEKKDIKEQKQIDEKRDELVELCYEILDLFKNEEHEIKDYINDVLLWMHVSKNVTESIFREKITEICERYEKVINERKSEKNTEYQNSINELENLCISIKAVINSNFFSNKEENIVLLEKTIDKTLDLIIDETLSEEMIKDLMNNINVKCNEIYNNLIKH